MKLGHKVSLFHILFLSCFLAVFIVFAFAFYVARFHVALSSARSADYGFHMDEFDGMSWAGAGF